jgi:Flp pilus assembly protein TadG
LLRDRRGSTIVEFAFVAPVMILLLLGIMDICHRLYVQSILTGAVQRAGRDSALETGSAKIAELDQKVVDAVRTVATNLTWDSKRSAYSNYTAIAPEPYTDTNSNSLRDPGECYADLNGNAQWDADPGKSGQGYANDTVVYTMNIHYDRLFPLVTMLGLPAIQDMSASTLLKNQPYDKSADATPVTICT